VSLSSSVASGHWVSAYVEKVANSTPHAATSPRWCDADGFLIHLSSSQRHCRSMRKSDFFINVERFHVLVVPTM
jgi:hypothetical protein